MKRCTLVLLLLFVGCLMPQPGPVPVDPVKPPTPVNPVGPVDPSGPQAWVVTEHLPDTGPPEPSPTPFVPQVDPDPAPQPSRVCSCGCGRVNCTCAKNSQYGCTETSDAPPRKPVLIVNDSALEFTKLQPTADPVIAYAPPWCGTCASWQRFLGAGDATLRIEWRHEELPPEIARQSSTAPSLTYRGKVLWQHPVGQTLETIKSRVREMQGTQGQATATVAAVNVGAIQGRAAVATLLQAVTKPRTGETVLLFGSAAIILPPKMRCALELSPDVVRATFDGPKPMVRYGSGILSVSRPITFIEANRDMMTVGVDGLPDLSFRLE